MFLEIEKINKYYGEGENRNHVLKDVTTGVEKGKICVLLGPSGSGKSTLLNIIGGIDEADGGNIIIDGAKLEDMKEKQLSLYRRKHLGYVFQMYNLIPNLTVKENIEVGAYLSDSPLDLNELLNTLGLWEHKDKLPNQLSGGQQQRTAIGRAIVKNPDILICDEPTGALDYNTSKEILQLIEKVNKQYGNTIIIVTHNDAIKNMADKVVHLHDGRIRKEYDNENDNSNVIYTKMNGYKFMFMADAGIEKEKDILGEYDISGIDVLKVGHHGSKTSSSRTFIDEINPKYSIISVGKNNRYGHPNKEVLNTLENSKIYRTDQDGSIMFKIKNNKLKIETCNP